MKTDKQTNLRGVKCTPSPVPSKFNQFYYTRLSVLGLGIQAGGQAGIQAYRYTGRRSHRQAVTQAGGQTGIQIYRAGGHTGIQTYRRGGGGIQAGGHTDI